MCLIIDTCCLAQVFDPKNKKHPNFAPVLRWISSGKGRMIYGGSKYNNELRAASKYLGIVADFERRGLTRRIPETQVDELADRIKQQVSGRDFNDEHLVALVIVSRCSVVCTNDNAAISYLKRKEFYSIYKLKKPKIYRSKRNKDLCSDRHIVGICLK